MAVQIDIHQGRFLSHSGLVLCRHMRILAAATSKSLQNVAREGMAGLPDNSSPSPACPGFLRNSRTIECHPIAL
jgi:hypothetical protein